MLADAERFRSVSVASAVNRTFSGLPAVQGIWAMMPGMPRIS
jgi:hypothetical protein